MVLAALFEDLDALNARIAEHDGPVRPAWLYRQERYRSLIESLQLNLAEWLGAAHTQITEAKRESLTVATVDAEDLALAAMGRGPDRGELAIRASFMALPAAALDAMIGRTSEGQPLALLLLQAIPEHTVAVRDALIAGVGRGLGTREIAREVRNASNEPLTRALTIARTEVIGAYRQATDMAYRESSVVRAWQWYAALNERTCPVCLAMHGTTHPLEESLDSHPACRCTKLPVTPSWSELGFAGVPDERPEIPTGAAEFERMTHDERLAIVGPARLQLIESGEATLQDLISFTQSAVWGRGRKLTPLAELTARSPTSAHTA